MNTRWKIKIVAIAGLTLLLNASQLLAQDTSTPIFSKQTTIWVDKKTGQLFIGPGKGRSPITFGVNQEEIERQVEERTQQRTQEAVRAAVAETQAQQRADNAVLQKQVDQIKPAWTSYMTNFQNKFRIGALAYLDYGLYTHTGFGPYFSENQNPPGPYNNMYNSFDISRIYLNTYFTPTDELTFRFTPELYRAIGNGTADKLGANSGLGSNLDGNLNVRMKYGYVQYSGLTDGIPSLKGGSVTFGAQQNPLLNWEEDFSQYRFVYVAPWNYVGLSSGVVGLAFQGPVKLFGGEKTYLDYGVGVYNNGNFNALEQGDTKQVMARVTAYPFGSAWRYQGLGITGFYDYGYGNITPDSDSLAVPLKGSDAHFTRMAGILSYATEEWNALGELDYGQNAFTVGTLFRGSGPQDAFGTPTGTPVTKGPFAGNTTCSVAVPCYPISNTYGPQTAAYQAILGNGRAREIGVDFLGHYHIPGTKLTAFGMFQWFMPNDKLNKDPLDFQRFVVGLSYQYNEYLRFALDSQNLLFYHDQFSLPTSYLSKFNYVPGGKFNGWLLPKTGSIPNLVPLDTHAIFLNMEFAY